MNKFKNGGMKVPAYIWADDMDSLTEDQIREISELPFIFHHIALMPDGHLGYGMPIGGVVATEDVIIPHFVGVDIGCGVQSIPLNLHKDDVNKNIIGVLVKNIKKVIPRGKNHHKKDEDYHLMPYSHELKERSIIYQEHSSALRQIGTLGGGNHFIEIQYSEKTGLLNLMLHSGSRNVGFTVANHYHKVAVGLCQKFHTGVPKDLSFLPIDTVSGQNYTKEMNWCVEFAKCSRTLMMDRCLKVFEEEFGEDLSRIDERLDVAHNYASLEHHFGKNVWVHRKGATQARKNQLGLIPGSMGTSSYLVRGKGNKDSFMSCSHGAGRTMSRSKAKDTLDLDLEMERLDSQGIVHDMRSRAKLDEATTAYKDIDSVMENQKDLIRVIDKFIPMGVIKG